jgi:20S proteasome alpha/beta subunit
MTTIAYRSGLLAADTLISYSSITNGSRKKIAECGRYTVALAGMAWIRKPLEQWCAAGCPDDVPQTLIDNGSEFAALIIDNNTGELFEFDNGYLIPIYADYTAIGSGGLLALGAMAHGATAEEAVLAASKHDKNTGGPVTILSLPIAA